MRYEPSCDDFGTLFLGPGKDDDADIWGPSLELTGPVLERRFEDDDKAGASNRF